jgi:hypothetical protein
MLNPTLVVVFRTREEVDAAVDAVSEKLNLDKKNSLIVPQQLKDGRWYFSKPRHMQTLDGLENWRMEALPR